MMALNGVGHSAAGQWEEVGHKALHIRRRLTETEAAKVGGVVDVRHTPEAQRRFERMRKHLPVGWTEIM